MSDLPRIDGAADWIQPAEQRRASPRWRAFGGQSFAQRRAELAWRVFIGLSAIAIGCTAVAAMAYLIR